MTHPDTLQLPRAVVEQAIEALEQLMRWQVKNVHVWNNSSYDNADNKAKALRAALQPQAAVTTSGPPERDNSKPAEQQAALTAALGALKRLAKRDGWKPFVTEDANDQWKPAEQYGLDAIAQIEALGE